MFLRQNFPLGTGSVKPDSTAEFNFFSDPESAHIVLKEMRCPIVIVPYETYLKESIKVHSALYTS